MGISLGAVTPSAFKVGTADCSAIYLGTSLVWSGTPAPTSFVAYSDTFSSATLAPAWQRATAYPTSGTVSVVNNAMVLATGSTAAWTGAASIFLGDASTPQGKTGVPAIASNWDYTFDYGLTNLSEHYPSIMLRGRNAELWPGGGGQNQFQTGTSIVLGVSNGTIEVVTNYNTTTVGTLTGFTFPSNLMKMRILVKGKRLAFKIWASTGTEPGGVGSDTNWTYNNATVMADESDGSIGFEVANGAVGEQKTVTIDNFTATTPVLGIGTTTLAPTTEKSGFTRIYTEDFTDVAPAGTGASSFLNVYSTRVQPYDESAPNYQQRALLSAHDSVMDVAMNGTQGAAWVWGSVATANSFIGGRFSMRAKTIGAFNNGPAVMIWPSNDVWVEGEIDFPESVSGPGGTQGFQDSPWIHHHTMNTDHPEDQSAAQDVALLVSWRDWHTYTAEWYPPGKGTAPATGMVIYYVDDVEVYRTTTDIPKTNHRFMAQVGAYGAPGNMYIDWVTMATIN